MEESKPERIPLDHSKSIYYLIKGNEPNSLTGNLGKENGKNVEKYSNKQESTHDDDSDNNVLENACKKLQTEITKHVETEDNETGYLKMQHIPITYSINDNQFCSVLPTATDYENDSTESCGSSLPTTESIYNLGSTSATESLHSPDILNAELSPISIYSLTNRRLPMADLYSQYHVVSQHGYSTSTSSINTCGTRSSTPTFNSCASNLTGTGDSDTYFDSEVDSSLEPRDKLGEIKRDNHVRKQAFYGSYDVKSHFLDSNVEFEDIMLTSMENSEGICAESKWFNISEPKVHVNVPTHETITSDHSSLPISQHPQTPTQFNIFVTKATNSTGTEKHNGNHKVQNMSSEMYKTMKQAIKPGKVNELKTIFSTFSDDQNTENMFLPMEYQQTQEHSNTLADVDSSSYTIASDTQSGFCSDNADEKFKGNKTDAEELMEEKFIERIEQERNLSDNERPFKNLQIAKEKSYLQTEKTNLKQKQIQYQESKQPEYVLLEKLQTPLSKVQPVKELKTSYFTDADLRSASNIDYTHSMPDCLVTSSYTQKDDVSITGTTDITITKPELVIMTPTVNKVIEVESNNVSREIIPTLAPTLLPAAKNEAETRGAELLQEAELSRDKKESVKEIEKKEDKPKIEEKIKDEWKEEEKEEPIINLNAVYLAGESAAVMKKEEEEKKIGENHRERVEEKVEDTRSSNEEVKEKIWRKAGEIILYEGRQDGVKQTETLEKELNKQEIDLRKEEDSLNDMKTIIKIKDKNDSDIQLNEKPDSLEKSLINDIKKNIQDVKATESLPTSCIETCSFSLDANNETLTTTVTIEPTTVTTVSNKTPLVSDTPSYLVNNSDLTSYNNSSPVITAVEENIINSVPIPTCQTSDTEEIFTAVSQIANLTSSTASSTVVLQPSPTFKANNGLLCKLQPNVKSSVHHTKVVKESERQNTDYGSDYRKEIEVIKRKETKDELINQTKINQATNEIKIKNSTENETKEINKEILDKRRITPSSSAVRRTKSEVTENKKEVLLSRAESVNKLKMLTPTVHSSSESNKNFTDASFPFKALRQMFEEGRPLKRDDEVEGLPPAVTIPAYPTNIYPVDQNSAKEATFSSYPLAPHEESYLTTKTTPLGQSCDVYLSKQSKDKINKNKITCKSPAPTNQITTATPVTANINQQPTNRLSTSPLSSATLTGWLGGPKVKGIQPNANKIGSFSHENGGHSDNSRITGFSNCNFEEEKIPLESVNIRERDSYTISKTNVHDTNAKDQKVVETITVNNDNFIPLNTVPSVVQDNQLEEFQMLQQNDTNQSDTNDLNENGNALTEKVSSFRISTHLSKADNRAIMEEAILPPDTLSRDDYSTTINLNISKDNTYLSQIDINSASLIQGTAQNIFLLEKEKLTQNDSEKTTDNMTIGTNFVPGNMYQIDKNLEYLVPENTILTSKVPISVNVLTPGISTSDVNLSPMQSVQLNDINSRQANIVSTNEINQTVIETTPHLVNEVNINRNIDLTEAINTTPYNSVGVDSVSQGTLSNNNEDITINSVSVSSPGRPIQYYNDSHSSTDNLSTALDSTTLYTTLTPVATGLTSFNQGRLSSTWNAGISIPTTIALNEHHHQQQHVMEQNIISSPTLSSVYVSNTEGTGKLEDETPGNIQGNVFRRVLEFEKTPEDHKLEKKTLHSFRNNKTADLLVNQEEDVETTYERVKRNLRPIPTKNDNHLNLDFSTIRNSDSTVDDFSKTVDDMSSLRSSQTPSYYSVNESITSFPESYEDHIVDQVNTDHHYAVVRLTPSNTDVNKVKHTIYCEVGGGGGGNDIKNGTSSFNDLIRQESHLSNASFSIPSTAASDTEDELSDATSDKEFMKKRTRTANKNNEIMSKQNIIDTVETNFMKKNTYTTEKNTFFTSTMAEKSRDNRMYHANSEIAIDSGTGTEIISSEGEIEYQETTETWCEYQKIPYEKYEEMNKSNKNISMETTVTSLRAPPPTTLPLSLKPTKTTQHSESDKLMTLTDSFAPEKPLLTKSDSGQIYEVHTEPETVSQEGEEDLKIVRGKLLIKNTIDSPKDGDDFDDNINVFAEEFHLDKENPLYQSDPDIFKQEEEDEQEDKEDKEEKVLMDEWKEDITFDQVDLMAQNQKNSTEVMKMEMKGKQNLSNLLLSRLSNLDSKDIKQSINVEHHHEEIYGDIDFIHADGTKASSDYTENFDSIAENVELLLKSGKAVIVIKVIAERIIPIDYEFNVWRKSSAIVTRQIELDLLANEQRKRLYNHVMENAGIQQAIEPKKYGSYLERTQGTQETVLNSRETFRLFNQLLTVAENNGEGGDQNEVYSEKTERLALQKPCISDFMY